VKDSDKPTHAVLNLDKELVVSALLEALELLRELQSRPDEFLQASPRLSLRLCYALLHSDAPEFRRAEVRQLALFHQSLAQSILEAQRHLSLRRLSSWHLRE